MRKNGSGRTVQHKPERQSEEREKQRLKRENRELKKTVTRLRREVEKSRTIQESAQVIVDEHQQTLAATAPVPTCESCGGSNLTRFQLPNGGGTLVVCKDCKSRKKEP